MNNTHRVMMHCLILAVGVGPCAYAQGTTIGVGTDTTVGGPVIDTSGGTGSQQDCRAQVRGNRLIVPCVDLPLSAGGNLSFAVEMTIRGSANGSILFELSHVVQTQASSTHWQP